MPKVQRKRRATSTRPVTRSSKKAKIEDSTTDDNEENLSVYYDLSKKQNQSLKSKKTGELIKSTKLPKNLKVPDDWNVNVGDVLSWSEERPTETYFVSSDRTLIKNPDTSGSGYLTIPLSISSLFDDATNYFKSVFDRVGRNNVTSVELLSTDKFFLKYFSKESLPTTITSRTDIKYSFDPSDESLIVSSSSNPDKYQHFPLDSTKTKDIIDWISKMNESESTLTVTFHFQGNEICKKVPRGRINKLPTGWKCEQNGSLTIGDEKVQGQWKCLGPEKSKANARKAIERFYKGMSVNIE